MSTVLDGALQVRVVAPANGPEPLATLLGGIAPSGEPFSQTRRITLDELSRAILKDPALRADAASVALAYWLRRANLERLAEDFERRSFATRHTVLVPVGPVFHVAPANVDTLFVYSWALSYLCGNPNVVRVSSQPGAILEALLFLISWRMQSDAELAAGNRFITYEHDQAISEALSRWCAHRVVWGGDATAALFRALPLGSHASERTFGDKFSYAVIASESYLAATDESAGRLAAAFFNDVFWFDQMACSSPHLLFWVGSADRMNAAIDRFHRALAAEIERRGHRGAASNAMRRIHFVFDLACETDLRANLGQREFLAVRLPAGAEWRREVCGGGLFTHTSAADLERVAEFCGPGDQTVTHFGFSEEELRAFARRAGARGIDRIVPIGEALAFDTDWDGYDLIGDFLRRVTVRTTPQR